MSRRYRHVAKNHEIAKPLEIGAEIAKLQSWGLRGEMVTSVRHQCVRQPQNRRGLCRKFEKKFEIVFFFIIPGNIFLLPEDFCPAVIDGLM